MSYTVVVGAFAHETNTFVSEPVTRSDFQERQEYLDGGVRENLRGTETAVGGVIDVADEEDVELVHTVSAFATPGGVVDDETYDFYTDRILTGVRDHIDELDGVILPLHGAMVSESHTDGEGPLIEAVRDLVGESIPIVVTLDLHGNVSERMVEAADALVAYETYPHLDKAETGRRGMRLLIRAMENAISPAMHFERPPMIAYQPKAYTPDGPMAEVMAHARRLEERDGVLKVNVLPGFYHADILEMGFTVPVVTDDDPDLARQVSRELAELAWEMREAFVEEYPKPAEAIEQARERAADLEPGDGPIVMADFGSNPGGGGASNGTTVLREMLDQGVENAGWAIMYDPEAVDDCLEAGVGNRVTTTIGGKSDDRHGEPIEDIDGYVKAITDGRYVNTGTSHSGQGVQNDIGTTVRFQCGQDDSMTVVLARTRASAFDAEIWRHIGQPPERLSMICIPSLIAFLGDYEPMSSEVILIDTPGTSAVNPARFEYSKIPRPIFPLDDLDEDAYPA
ncbi:M81 family metallopeptidase [Halorarum salinum]|uniref:M81 family metallopeptidase n=1 Tax=Halorarum salinum TaxID=2743089 RepID=A0A7D5L9U1_9EURY|nr:M81 family metallopeptidase [Halobaculum salinum]QLG61055.1 M81 family metallopeptidase [Halobaculum salinum]